MTSQWFQKARPADELGYDVLISPESAGWNYSSLRVVTLRPKQTHRFSTEDSEWIVLPLAGSCVVASGDSTFELEGRTSVFDRVSDFAYVPRDTSLSVTSDDGGRFALAGAKARKVLPARYGRAEDVLVEIRGAGGASRQVNNFASPESFETDRLIAVEVITPGGNWSSYPPHKHDQDRQGEAVLEEIYYFEVHGGASGGQPGPGAYQRVYGVEAGRSIDVLAEVNSGDTVLIPYGYHGPSMAAPGYDLYFLNVLAGPGATRTMAFCDDPEHGWIRDTWKDQIVDPRLPMTSFRAPA
jgi:5-deoxy-glucuronate isomerase